MSRRVTNPEFIEWLDNQLDVWHWNDSQASKLAGLDKGAISEIRRGINPGAKKCIALARLFKRPESEALALAGHLPDMPSRDGDFPPQLDVSLEEIREIVTRFSPEIQAEFVRHMLDFAKLLEDIRVNRTTKEPSDVGTNET